MNRAIFWPVVALVALTFAVWIRLYVVRLGEMRAQSIRPQALADSRLAADTLRNVTAADNFRNLFELPVLFYVICCGLAICDAVTSVQLTLAWLFVALRVAHSFIHVTYNRVLHRFTLYVLGALCLFAMWLLFALRLAGVSA